jgi:hypothetical protein
VSQTSSDWTSGSGPWNQCFVSGATIHERTPIGIAAAAQTPKIFLREYCGMPA